MSSSLVSQKPKAKASPRSRAVIRALEEESVYRARDAGVLATRGRRFRLIDLFAGAGGMTLGFTDEAGAIVLAATERPVPNGAQLH